MNSPSGRAARDINKRKLGGGNALKHEEGESAVAEGYWIDKAQANLAQRIEEPLNRNELSAEQIQRGDKWNVARISSALKS
ncbi:hypothetical protein R1flu_009267 [Riccia fluitans]|uniref:Uncharacterized protein n=1 Tax=Riccia fluitans TaxID=41844 RepID=A0ABD1Z1U7_9MARC